MKLAINASNLHVGGGVQVAASFINELINNSMKNETHVYSSKKVSCEILDDSFMRLNFKTLDIFGFDFISSEVINNFKNYDVVFTVFGPLYKWTTPFKSIVGFAQPWIIFPENECYSMLSNWQKIKTKLKYWIQSIFFKRADVLVVELEHVKQGLIKVLGIPAEKIHVVHNCISSVYLTPSLWQPVQFFDNNENVVDRDCLKLGFLGRNYLHKNTKIFPEVAKILRDDYGLKVKFYVTFKDDEWRLCSPEFKACSINVGELSVVQCPNFYELMDGVIFPSLLECFSATPLEAMAMKKPLIASDRPFNRDVCSHHAHYFDPLSPKDAADQIAKVFSGNGPDFSKLKEAREHALKFSTPKERAEKYLSIMMGKLDDQKISH